MERLVFMDQSSVEPPLDRTDLVLDTYPSNSPEMVAQVCETVARGPYFAGF